MLQIKVEERAQRFIRGRPHKHARQITGKIDLLAVAPFPSDSKFLARYDVRRADVGEYRIIYKVIGATLLCSHCRKT